MWIFVLLVILLILVLVWLVYFLPKYKFGQFVNGKCQRSSYFSYPEWNLKDPTKFLFILNVNVFLSNCPNLGPIPVPEGFTVKEITGLYDDMYGYIFENPNTVIIAFTGTFYYYQWKLDQENNLVPINNSEVLVHEGFLTIYNSFRNQVRSLNLEGKNIYLTGISLGGAMASLAALDLARYHPKVYTFASPKVFNKEGADLVNRLVPDITRIYNTADPVPNHPPNPDYNHVGQPQTFTLDLGSPIRNHTQAYQRYFGLK